MTEMKVYILVLTFIEIAVFEMQGLQSMAELNQNSCLQLQRKFFRVKCMKRGDKITRASAIICRQAK